MHALTATDRYPDDHVRGPEDAPFLLLYGDYECPYTRLASRHVQQVEERGIPVRFVFRHFPLTEIHLHALSASLAAEAAARQGRFWAMHDLLFHRQKALGPHALVRYAQDLHLGIALFNSDALDRHTLARVRRDVGSGSELGVQGTPSLFLDGARLEAYGFDDLVAALEQRSIPAPIAATDARA